jgi:hypothetical protein
MAVVAGVVFFVIRALLALIPALTVTFPIKKWAAASIRSRVSPLPVIAIPLFVHFIQQNCAFLAFLLRGSAISLLFNSSSGTSLTWL